MNELIKKQLEMCHVAPIPSWDENTNELFIPCLFKGSIKQGHYYILKLNERLVLPERDIFHDTYNRGIVPECNVFKCECIKVEEDRIRIEGHEYNYKTNMDGFYSWGGWLPMNSVEIIKELSL